MKIGDLDTPALVVDLDRLERNLDRVAAYAARHSLALRPHTKTHKTPEIARMQLDRGAVGLTVAKTTEAEPLLDAEPREILIAYPIWGEAKLRRTIELSRRVRVIVALDSRETADRLSEASAAAGSLIDILVEADVGMRRCGLPPGDGLVELAQHVEGLPGLRLRGVMFYPGHFWAETPEGPELLQRLSADVARIRKDFDAEGLPLEIVSGGSTPTLFHSHEISGMTEIRPGTYVFCDRMQVGAGVCGWEDCAATVLTTVVSTPEASRALIDGGSKSFSSDALPRSDEGGFGRILEAPTARFHSMNEEHGYLDLSNSGVRLRIGDRLRIIPNHVCVAVNMHEKMYAIRGDEVEAVWDVRGRGKLQ